MNLSVLLLLVAIFLAIALVGVALGVRRGRQAQPGGLTAPQLSALAQPYRSCLGEALAIQRDVAAQARRAPESLRYELESLAWRLERLVERALPRAQQGSRLAVYLLELHPDEPQYAATKTAAEALERELAELVETLRTLRGKVYQVLTDAAELAADPQLKRDLGDALIDVAALEEAFGEIKLDT